jgi:DNA-directed RNA polymerase subunit RPC12/RpoP
MAHGQVQCPNCEKYIGYEERKPQKLMSPFFLVTVLIWAMTYALPIESKGLSSLSFIASMSLTIHLLRRLKSFNGHRCSHCGYRWEEIPDWKT